MKRRVVRMILAATALLMIDSAWCLAAQNSESSRAAIDQYCISCHNDRLKTAGLSFEKLDFTNLAANADIWEKAVRKLRVGMMPPQGAAQPDGATRQSLVSWLVTELDRAAAGSHRHASHLRKVSSHSLSDRKKISRSARARSARCTP